LLHPGVLEVVLEGPAGRAPVGVELDERAELLRARALDLGDEERGEVALGRRQLREQEGWGRRRRRRRRGRRGGGGGGGGGGGSRGGGGSGGVGRVTGGRDRGVRFPDLRARRRPPAAPERRHGGERPR